MSQMKREAETQGSCEERVFAQSLRDALSEFDDLAHEQMPYLLLQVSPSVGYWADEILQQQYEETIAGDPTHLLHASVLEPALIGMATIAGDRFISTLIDDRDAITRVCEIADGRTIPQQEHPFSPSIADRLRAPFELYVARAPLPPPDPVAVWSPLVG